MPKIVKLRWDERPQQEPYLLISSVARIRGFDFYVRSSPALAGKVQQPTPHSAPGYASAESALAAARDLAEEFGVDTVYVEAVPGPMGRAYA